MVTARLSCEDATEKGWLLDGYPRTLSQAESLQKLQIRPDIYLILDVCTSHTNLHLLGHPFCRHHRRHHYLK